MINELNEPQNESQNKIISIQGVTLKGSLLMAMCKQTETEAEKKWNAMSTGAQYAALPKKDLIYYVDVMFKYNKGPMRIPYQGTEEEEQASHNLFNQYASQLDKYQDKYGRESFETLMKNFPIDEAISRVKSLETPKL